jgi:hypothetical protein
MKKRKNLKKIKNPKKRIKKRKRNIEKDLNPVIVIMMLRN